MSANVVGYVAAGLLAGLVAAGLNGPAAAPAAPAAGTLPATAPAAAPRENDSTAETLAGLRRLVHGEVTVRAGDGEFQTYAGQRGTLTTLTATTLRVRSADGYVRTYVRTPDTTIADGVAVGGQVRVVALVEDGDARALFVRRGRPARVT